MSQESFKKQIRYAETIILGLSWELISVYPKGSCLILAAAVLSELKLLQILR